MFQKNLPLFESIYLRRIWIYLTSVFGTLLMILLSLISYFFIFYRIMHTLQQMKWNGVEINLFVCDTVRKKWENKTTQCSIFMMKNLDRIKPYGFLCRRVPVWNFLFKFRKNKFTVTSVYTGGVIGPALPPHLPVTQKNLRTLNEHLNSICIIFNRLMRDA